MNKVPRNHEGPSPLPPILGAENLFRLFLTRLRSPALLKDGQMKCSR